MRWALVALMLAGCVAEVPPEPRVSYREASAPIASTTRGTPQDLAGNWVIVATFPGGPGALGDQLSISPIGANWEWQFLSGATQMTVSGPGRYDSGRSEFWVLWVDESYRTAVIGTPGGEFGWIMDRNSQIPADRLRAAREILEFNGYNVERLG